MTLGQALDRKAYDGNSGHIQCSEFISQSNCNMFELQFNTILLKIKADMELNEWPFMTTGNLKK